MTGAYETLRTWFADNLDDPVSGNDRSRREFLEMIERGDAAPSVDDLELIQPLAAFGFERAAAADALDRTPSEIDDLARVAGMGIDENLDDALARADIDE